MLQLILLAGVLVALYYTFGGGNKSGTGQRKKVNEPPFQGRFSKPPPNSQRAIDKGAMTRCHNCGTFFPESKVVNKVIEGHVLEFCSRDCRDNFRYP